MADYSQDALYRRMTGGYQDPRSTSGEYARGSNVYNGGLNNTGGYQAARTTADQKSGSQPQYSTFGQKSSTPQQQGDQPYTFQFNPVYAARMRQLQQQRSGLNSQMELGERRLGENYAFGMDTLQRALDRGLENNEINMADQGILRSGINVRQQGRIGEEYQRGVSDLSMDVARQREDMQRQFASGEQGIMNAMEQIEMQRAQQEMQARREEEFRNAEMEALQRAVENMQPVMDSSGRYHVAGWQPITNTQYGSGVSHDLLSPIQRRLTQ